MKNIFTITVFLCACNIFAGTLIYRDSENEKKFLSQIDIVSIDKNIITLKIGKTTRTIPFSKVMKYYNSDINLNLAFDDNTSEYGLDITKMTLPANKKGVTLQSKKRPQTNKISLEYSLNMKKKKNQSKAVKTPYFYLFVLAGSANHSGNNMFTYCYPAVAKTKNTSNYNEALMLEKAISSERPILDSEYVIHGDGVRKNNNTVTFDLKGIGNREIIAYRIVVWGKDDIIYEKNEIVNHRYNLSKNWHLHAKSGK